MKAHRARILKLHRCSLVCRENSARHVSLVSLDVRCVTRSCLVLLGTDFDIKLIHLQHVYSAKNYYIVRVSLTNGSWFLNHFALRQAKNLSKHLNQTTKHTKRMLLVDVFFDVRMFGEFTGLQSLVKRNPVYMAIPVYYHPISASCSNQENRGFPGFLPTSTLQKIR